MAEFFFQRPATLEVELMFSTYSFKFYSYQNIMRPKQVISLYFQRFVSLSEYPSLHYISMAQRYCAQLEIPAQETQTEYQKLFFSTLSSRSANQDRLIAEAVNEDTENIYLIFDQNDNPGVTRFLPGCTLEVFEFCLTELISISQNAFTYLSNLQRSGICLFRQFQETMTYYEFFKQHASSWQMQVLNADLQLDKKIEDIKKKSVPDKPIQKVPAKIDLPSVECLLCCTNNKNIVFLPCGHIVACKKCTTENLEIGLAKIINQRRSPRSCPICKQPIKEAREVFN